MKKVFSLILFCLWANFQLLAGEREQVEERFNLMNANSVVKIDFKNKIYSQIKTFLADPSMPTVIAVFRFFEPCFSAKLEQYEVPDELKYLTLIESSINGRTVSSAGAMGFWQLMPDTGAEYGLFRDAYVNDWYNVVSSSDAAGRYLRRSYAIFKDWNLALVSYNCGIGNVKKALALSDSKNFWSIYPYLPKETRDYIVRYYAMKYIDNFGQYHNFSPKQLKYSWDNVKIIFYNGKQKIVKDDWFYFLNPHILTDKIPLETPILVIK